MPLSSLWHLLVALFPSLVISDNVEKIFSGECSRVAIAKGVGMLRQKASIQY
jgi:hypothetical protein